MWSKGKKIAVAVGMTLLTVAAGAWVVRTFFPSFGSFFSFQRGA